MRSVHIQAAATQALWSEAVGEPAR